MDKCRVCGCTWSSPCEGGCHWVEKDLCSRCDTELRNKKIEEVTEKSPGECPITGMSFNGLVLEEDGSFTPVYGGPYTSYTIPEYYKDEKCFYRRVYDEDEGCWSEECQHFAELQELKEELSSEKYEEIKKFYDIQD